MCKLDSTLHPTLLVCVLVFYLAFPLLNYVYLYWYFLNINKDPLSLCFLLLSLAISVLIPFLSHLVNFYDVFPTFLFLLVSDCLSLLSIPLPPLLSHFRLISDLSVHFSCLFSIFKLHTLPFQSFSFSICLQLLTDPQISTQR